MITLEKLQTFGADTGSGLGRCLGREDFYLRMVGKVLSDTAEPQKLKEALDAGDVKTAFEKAHALKGVYGNLSLTPLFEPVSELTEILRAGTLEGAQEYYDAFYTKYQEFLKLAE
ncbi:MAG: Hpt domain-containing protein [Lachnospiraceae bacterium]|nr:Hpt domain-containing protein [Lachnospiraceae bacterium]